MHRLGALLGLVVAAQVPEPPSAGVRWDAPADCPDGPTVAAAIEQRLGRPLAPGEATIDAHVTTTTARLDARVELWLAGKHEVRTLTAASCAPLVEAVALVVAAARVAARRDAPGRVPPAPQRGPTRPATVCARQRGDDRAPARARSPRPRAPARAPARRARRSHARRVGDDRAARDDRVGDRRRARRAAQHGLLAAAAGPAAAARPPRRAGSARGAV